MNLFTRTEVIYKVKHRYAIRLKFGDKFLTSLIKLVLPVKASICSTVEEIYFYIVVSFQHLLSLS